MKHAHVRKHKAMHVGAHESQYVHEQLYIQSAIHSASYRDMQMNPWMITVQVFI